MNSRVFIATIGQGLRRAQQAEDGAWSLQPALKNHVVRCLAADPLNPHLVCAGTLGNGVFRSQRSFDKQL